MSRDVLTESAPLRVWLQVDTDGNPDDRSEAIPRDCWSDLTWCYESIGGQEVTYVREDRVRELIEKAEGITPVLDKSTPLLNAYRNEIEAFRAALAALTAGGES